MVKLNLGSVGAILQREGDWAVRLLNKTVPPPKRYVFALLWFNGNTGLWMARFLEQNLGVAFEESKKEFSEARQILVRTIANYVSKGYKITGLTSGYDIPPWLQRKR